MSDYYEVLLTLDMKASKNIFVDSHMATMSKERRAERHNSSIPIGNFGR